MKLTFIMTDYFEESVITGMYDVHAAGFANNILQHVFLFYVLFYDLFSKANDTKM